MKYNKKHGDRHEDNLKTQLYLKCKQEGIRLVLEYSYKNSRFDGVIVRKDEILAIIEVKKWPKPKARKVKFDLTRQLKKYLSYGLPVFVLYQFNGLRYIMRRIKKIVQLYDEHQAKDDKGIWFYPEVNKTREPTGKELLAKLIKQQKIDNNADKIYWANPKF